MFTHESRRHWRSWSTRFGWLLVFAAGIILAAPLSRGRAGREANAQSSGACAASSLSGHYGYSASGTIFLGDDGQRRVGGTPAPIASVGLIMFDGQGRLSGADTISVDGRPRRRTLTGMYTVGPDCMGTVTLLWVDTPFADEFTFVLLDGARELRATATDAGSSIVLTAKRQ
jgi:hypothetical protein